MMRSSTRLRLLPAYTCPPPRGGLVAADSDPRLVDRAARGRRLCARPDAKRQAPPPRHLVPDFFFFLNGRVLVIVCAWALIWGVDWAALQGRRGARRGRDYGPPRATGGQAFLLGWMLGVGRVLWGEAADRSRFSGGGS